MCRRSVRIQDNELRDLAEKIRQANQLKEREDSEVLVVVEVLVYLDIQCVTFCVFFITFFYFVGFYLIQLHVIVTCMFVSCLNKSWKFEQ